MLHAYYIALGMVCPANERVVKLSCLSCTRHDCKPPQRNKQSDSSNLQIMILLQTLLNYHLH